jgi:hypothetical protein
VISWGLAAGGLASIALASAAYADTVSLRTLLNEGFEIKSSNVISADIIQRAVNNSKWVDDYLVTLQRGNQIGFCHVALDATVDAAAFVDEASCTYSSATTSAGPAAASNAAPLAPAVSK